MRVARRRHRLGTERDTGGVRDTNPGVRIPTLQRRTVEGDGRVTKGAFTGESASSYRPVAADQKTEGETRKRRRETNGGGSDSEASENEDPDDPEEVAAADAPR